MNSPAEFALGTPTRDRRSTWSMSPSRAERTVRGLLQGLGAEGLTLHTPRGAHGFGPSPETALLHVHDPAAFDRWLRSGDIGFAESFIDGQWTTPSLAALLPVLMRQRDAIEAAVYGQPLGVLLHRLTHLLRRNSRRGSRRNITAHYDLGNAFYRLWLDPTMNYSSAWWGHRPERSLAEAQRAKMDRALDAAGVGPSSRLLEIGCGWGAVAEQAARRGAAVTGITLSPAQLGWANERLASAGLASHADLKLQDYRDLDPDGSPWDAIVSIEMLEAVGQRWWPTYFETVRRCLRPGGLACIQTIVIAEHRFDRYAKSTDFIQQHIFPGGMLPSVSQVHLHAGRAGLQVTDEMRFGGDYARTLALWREAFHAHLDALPALGFDDRFVRLWDLYLAWCEAAFATGQTDVVQFTLRRT